MIRAESRIPNPESRVARDRAWSRVASGLARACCIAALTAASVAPRTALAQATTTPEPNFILMRIPLNGYTFAPALVSGNLVGFLGWKGDFSGVIDPNAVMPIVWMEKVVDTQGNAGWNTVAWDEATGGGPGGASASDLTAASRWVQFRTGVARPFGRDGLLYSDPVAVAGVPTPIPEGEVEIATPVGVSNGLYNGDPLQGLMQTLPSGEQAELAQMLESVGYAVVPGFVPECPPNPTPTDPDVPYDQTNPNGRLPTTTSPAVMLAAGALLETSYWEALGMTREAAAMRAAKKCVVEIIANCTGCAGILNDLITSDGWDTTSTVDPLGDRECTFTRLGVGDFTWTGTARFGTTNDCLLCILRCPRQNTGVTQRVKQDFGASPGCPGAPTNYDRETITIDGLTQTDCSYR